MKGRKGNRGHLPAHLPREEIVIEPEAKACPCCGGSLHQIGEDRFRTARQGSNHAARGSSRVALKYACRSCEKAGVDDVVGIVQAPAPARLIEGGIQTEALVADVLVSKYADHLRASVIGRNESTPYVNEQDHASVRGRQCRT